MSADRTVRLLLATLVLALPGPAAVATATTSSSPARAVHWLCLPSRAADDCRGRLATTVQHADGTGTVRHPRRDPHPDVDCFYVYPTSSQQATPNSDGRSEASVRAVVRQQVSRLSSLCRVYVPLYRQRTLTALSAESAFTTAQRASFNTIAYADVLAAWRAYLRRDNHGRGFVLVGHSQGSRLLRKIVRDQIDPRPAVRARMVSAVLPGADVLVHRGRDVGGDFAHVRLCHRSTQTGCVMAWSTYGVTAPDDSRFGRTPLTTDASPGLGLPHGPQYAVACTDPASLAHDRRVRAHSVTRSEQLPGVLGVLLLAMYGGPPPSAATPWLVPAEHYTVHCEWSNGAHVLRLRPIGDARTLNPEPNATWGLHLVDVNIVLGDVMRVLRRQIAVFDRGRRQD